MILAAFIGATIGGVIGYAVAALLFVGGEKRD